MASYEVTTNNVVEYLVLEKGLEVAVGLGLANIQITRDSQRAVSLVQKLINGTPLKNISSSWRLELLVERIHAKLSSFEYIITEHTR